MVKRIFKAVVFGGVAFVGGWFSHKNKATISSTACKAKDKVKSLCKKEDETSVETTGENS